MFTERESQRIFARIVIDPITGCWNYSGYLTDGYARIFWRQKRYKAHRLMYLWKYGSLPEWTDKKCPEIDHICDNRRCVNPDHLRLVTPKENMLRGNATSAKNARKTHCKHGHDAFYQIGNRRRCRECRRLFDASDHRQQWRLKRLKGF